jgi:hypothetical protein
VFGRTTLGVSLGQWWGGEALAVTPDVFDASDEIPHPDREYMVDLYARVYPKAFAVNSGFHLSGYLGAFLGLDERERDESSSCPTGYACPLAGSSSTAICACPLIPASGSAAIPCSCSPLPTPAPSVTEVRAYGVEPGVEFGVRAVPTQYLVFEIGTWARVITFPDPTGRFQEGQLDPRLMLSLGVCW